MRRRIIAYIGLLVAFLAARPYGVGFAPIWILWICLIVYMLAVVLFTRTHRWYLTRLLSNGLIVACITVIGLWLISTVVYVRLPYASKRAIAIGYGSFFHDTGVNCADGSPLTLTARWHPKIYVLGHWGSRGNDWGSGKMAISRFIPIWPFVIALTIPTIVLRVFVPKRYPAGHCQHCGYNLTGNESGVCPECGIEVSA